MAPPSVAALAVYPQSISAQITSMFTPDLFSLRQQIDASLDRMSDGELALVQHYIE